MHAYAIGDLHLTDDRGLGGLAKYIDEPDRYVMSEVQRVVKHGTRNGISDYFFEGDICENPRMSYAAHIALSEFFDRNPKSMFYVIVGNHDKFGNESSLGHSLQLLAFQHFKNVRLILEPEIIKIQGTKVHFHPWPSQNFSKKLLNVAHVEVRGSKSDSGRAFDSDELSKSKAVTVCGHLHTNHRVRNTWYTGTLYQTNFGESLPKFFHHINFKSVDDYSVENIPFDPRYKLHTCVVDSMKALKKIPTDSHDLVKLIIEEGSDIDPESPILSNPNIVQFKAFKTKQELQLILTEDLTNSEELVIRTEEFFDQWVKHQKVPDSVFKRAVEIRSELLGNTK